MGDTDIITFFGSNPVEEWFPGNITCNQLRDSSSILLPNLFEAQINTFSAAEKWPIALFFESFRSNFRIRQQYPSSFTKSYFRPNAILVCKTARPQIRKAQS